MNKTININLGGSFFHIDESAYFTLKKYLESVKASLSDDPKGRDEILADIESRIGELLSEKIKDVRQVVNENDINEIIEVMGKPEDYSVDEDVFMDYSTTYTHKKSKKLYRDADDKFLGGVSSGMAHYFNIDVIWIRLAWLIAAFGFGFGFIVYPILWILLPQANTTAEKLEMMGEAVNISNIEKKIKEELNEAGERIKAGFSDASQKVKNADYQKYGNKAKSGAQELVDAIGNIFGTIFMVIGKLIGILLIIVSLSLLVALVIGVFTLGSIDFVHDGWVFDHSLFFNNSGLPIWLISILSFLLIGIPVFWLFLLGLRILSSKAKTMGKTGNLSLLGIWLVALVTSIFFGTKQVMQTAFDGVVNENKELFVSTADTLTIKFVDHEKLGNSELRRSWGYDVVTDYNNEDRVYSTNIRFDIHQADGETAYMKIRKKSKGNSRESAREFAEMIDYRFMIDSTKIELNGYFLTDLSNKFKEQKLYIDLYLPENQMIYLDKSTESYLYDVDNFYDIYDKDMARHFFVMHQDGLKCTDCDLEWSSDGNDNGDGTVRPESFNMKIDDEGVHIDIVDDTESKATVKIDKNGIKIEGEKDSI
ncbi:PspC domain-containing protein [Namhaeicola litoreus]|uniref:PspC domain-containing protein n=1 Tax=Namhaeicola litoreus TaxID=1052145 RepID=A0ABW3Y3Q7_9FLAO